MNNMIFEILISLVYLVHELGELCDRPSVYLQHLFGLYKVIGIKVCDISEDISRGISNLEIHLGKLLEDLLGNSYIDAVIGRSNPESQYICAILLNYIEGIDSVAERFGHLLALSVDDPAVSKDILIGSALSLCGNSRKERGLEPASVLVCALEVEVCGPVVIVVSVKYDKVCGTAVEPAVQSIYFLGEVCSSAVGALEAFGNDLLCLMQIPCVGALGAEQLGNRLYCLVCADRLAALLTIEHGNGQTPTALTGNTPVGALTNHGYDSVFAPGGRPVYFFTCLDGLLLKGVNRAEPLGSSSEYDGILTSPAVGIRVDYVFISEESSCLLKMIEYEFVGFFVVKTCELTCVLCENTLVIDRHKHWQIVSAACEVVVGTVSGSCVYAACTGIHCDIVCCDYEAVAVEEGMLSSHVLKLAALELGDDLIILNAALLHCGSQQLFGCYVDISVLCLGKYIVLIGVEGDGEVARQCPCCSCPNDEVKLVEIAVLRELALVVLDLKAYIY